MLKSNLRGSHSRDDDDDDDDDDRLKPSEMLHYIAANSCRRFGRACCVHLT